MPLLFRHGDPRLPFLWETTDQPPARWHDGAGAPANYLADTADGAWAEFVRHEAITDPEDLRGVARRLWVVEVDDETLRDAARPELHARDQVGDLASHPACQAAAARLRRDGATALRAPSAALRPGCARGQHVDGGLREADARDGEVLVLFGRGWTELTGWAAVDRGAPAPRLLELVRHLE